MKILALIASDRVLHETLFYFVGVHFLRQRQRRIAYRIIHYFDLHRHCRCIKHYLMRFCLLIFACSHKQLVNHLGVGLLLVWLGQDIYQQAHIHAYIVDSFRVSIGMIALRWFDDWL